MPFKKNDPNINRRGRLTSQVSEIRRLILKRLNVKRDGKAAVDRLIDKLTAMAITGNLEAAKLLLSYAYGKPETVLDAIGQAERPMTLRELTMNEIERERQAQGNATGQAETGKEPEPSTEPQDTGGA
jgi:hypothetical protein